MYVYIKNQKVFATSETRLDPIPKGCEEVESNLAGHVVYEGGQIISFDVSEEKRLQDEYLVSQQYIEEQKGKEYNERRSDKILSKMINEIYKSIPQTQKDKIDTGILEKFQDLRDFLSNK